MNKNIKKIIAITLALTSAPALIPNIVNFGTTAVYAASSSGYITNISVETNKDKTVNVYTKNNYSSNYKLSKISGEVPTKLYAQVASSVKKIKITDVDFGTNCDNVKIYKGSTEIDLDEEVKISSNVTLTIKAYSGTTLKQTYTLKIEKEDSDSSDDDIYLDDLSLTYDNDDIDFDFDKDKSSYDINVKNKVSYVKICADPEEDDYTVKVNGDTVDEGDDWTKKVSLSEGENTITVKIKDDDRNTREYTLNITRAKDNTSSTTSSTSSLSTSLKEGWQQISGIWYFIGPDGSKQTGWLKSPYSGKWYYMNDNGVMQTGWFKSPYSGKWYYLNPISNEFIGAMVTNTTIDGYKIGSDGARIN